jgi:hypothetical protein
MWARRIKLEGQFKSASSAEAPAINLKLLTMRNAAIITPLLQPYFFACVRGSGWQSDQYEHVLA